MKFATFVILGFALNGQTKDDETTRALAIIKKLDGRVELDAKTSGRPVVAVDL